MKTALFLLAFAPFTALAAPRAPSDTLTSLIPEGYSEGVTQKGAPCRVIFSSRGNEYARAQVIAEPEGNLVDVEIFLGAKRPENGRYVASASYRTDALFAAQLKGGRVFVRAENKNTKLIAACIVPKKR